MPTPKHLLRFQKGLYSQTKKELQSYLGKRVPTMSRYYRDYENEFRSYESISSKKALLNELYKSQIVYSGDYHTFPQSQKLPLRILRELIKKRKKIILSIEMMMSEHQEMLEHYLNGRISEKTFLKKINYEHHWGFQWKHIKPLMTFAKTHHLPIFGLNRSITDRDPKTTQSLERRDHWASKIIANLSLQHKDHLIYVIFGDLHLASSHLPHRVETLLKKRGVVRKKTIIYQNSEKIYWKLAEQGIENKADVIKLKPNTYCVSNATPWTKLQSYLQWIESMDVYDQVYDAIKSLSHYLHMPVKDLDSFHVYTSQELKQLHQELKKSSGKLHTPSWYINITKQADSYFIPLKDIIYFKDISANDVAEEASIYMFTRFAQLKSLPTRFNHFFYHNVMLRTIGYLGSKLINPKRTCRFPKDYELLAKRKAKRPHGNREKKIARAALPFLKGKLSDKQLFNEDHREDPWLAFEVSKALGYLLGEKIFHALYTGKLSRDHIIQLFNQSFTPSQSIAIYLEWTKRMQSITLKNRSRIDHV